MPSEPSQPSEQPSDDRLTRNWNELLQEVRVTQTGAQVLTGFLLTVPFSSRYEDLTDFQVKVYLAVLCGAVAATGLVVAPAAFHRLLFRQQQRPWIVRSADRAARAGLAVLALTCSGIIFLVFDVTVGTRPATIALGFALVYFGMLWFAAPLWRSYRASPD